MKTSTCGELHDHDSLEGITPQYVVKLPTSNSPAIVAEHSHAYIFNTFNPLVKGYEVTHDIDINMNIHKSHTYIYTDRRRHANSYTYALTHAFQNNK